MEATIRSGPIPFTTRPTAATAGKKRSGGCFSVPTTKARWAVRAVAEFCDTDHTLYYARPHRSPLHNKRTTTMTTSLEEDEEKKKMKNKLIKLLEKKNINIKDDAADQHNINDLSFEAAQLLVRHLQQLRAEMRESKRKAKANAPAKVKTLRTPKLDGKSSSSSSSSSSESDRDCEEVLDLSCWKNEAVAQAQPSQISTLHDQPKDALPITLNDGENASEQKIVQNRSPLTLEERPCDGTPKSACCGNGISNFTEAPAKRIEVCMGGKCRKSGAAALLEEFERVVGVQGAVVGCKCMGRCRDGPNVKLMNDYRCTNGIQEQGINDSVRFPTNPLFIGVNLEDVGTIAAKFS